MAIVTAVSDAFRLEDLLAEQRAKSAARMAPEAREVVLRETQALIDSGRAAAALKIGDRLPEAALTNAVGQRVALAALLDNGPLVVNFYRGGW